MRTLFEFPELTPARAVIRRCPQASISPIFAAKCSPKFGTFR
jgi:hypothetical protein